MATIRFRSWGIIKMRMPAIRARAGSILLKEIFIFIGYSSIFLVVKSKYACND
jgi:hypothetical protein